MSARRIPPWVFGELSWRRLGVSLIEVTVIVYAVMFVYGIVRADSLVFKPQPATYGLGEPYLQLKTGSGERLTVRHMTAPDARFTVLYSHGNAEDLGDLEPILEEFVANGYSVIAYDYAGYGTSTGSPSERGAFEEIRTVYEYLVEEQGVPARQVLVFGRSVGSSPSVRLAAGHPVGGLALEGAFVSASRAMTGVPVFPVERFDNLGRIRKVSCPTLVIHGTADEVIPLWHGEALYERANQPKRHLWVSGAHHDDVQWVAGAAYWEALAEFADLVAGSASAR